MRRYLWHFAGPRAEIIANHHATHLREFLVRNALEGCEVGVQGDGPNRFVAWLTAPEAAQAPIEKALRPPKRE